MKKALFPGSFDPFTVGHESIVNRSLGLFDEIVIGIGINSTKANLYSVEQRLQSIQNLYQNNPHIKVDFYEGLTVNYCKKIGAQFILRGLRNSSDFGFERGIAQVNKSLQTDIETIFMLCLPEHSAISSTIIRDIIRNGGKADNFIPNLVLEKLVF
jgi:pantetheine-phosphate adenylyltransferase